MPWKMPDEEELGDTTLVFRLCESAPNLIRQVFLEKGWKEFAEHEDATNDWNLWWKSSGFRTGDFEDIKPWQRMNHFPKSSSISRKDCLVRGLRRMRGVYGSSIFNFSPVGFNLPNEYRKFVSEWSKSRQELHENSVWICKPADLSRGRGIFIFRDLSELSFDGAAVVQQYIPNPLLISGYKLDLRIYVLVLSFHPLVIYTYHEGLVRFGTEKYDLSTLDNVYSHLTNTSINKFSPSYSTDKERIGQGCKWSLTHLRGYLRQMGIDDRLLWPRISAIIILTLLTQAPDIPSTYGNCFELFGFDILIDDNLKPWLIEVNFSPAMNHDCYLDLIVKKPLVNDLIELLDYTEVDSLRSGNDNSNKKPQKTRTGNKTRLKDKKSTHSNHHPSKKGSQVGRREKKTLHKTLPEEAGPSVCKRSFKDEQSDTHSVDMNISLSSLCSSTSDQTTSVYSTSTPECAEDSESVPKSSDEVKSYQSDEDLDHADSSVHQIFPELCNENASPVFMQAFAHTKSAQLRERRKLEKEQQRCKQDSQRDEADLGGDIDFRPRSSQGHSSVFGKGVKKHSMQSRSTPVLPNDSVRSGRSTRVSRTLSVDGQRAQARLTLPYIYGSLTDEPKKKYSDVSSRYLTSRWQVRTRNLHSKRDHPERLGDFERIFPFNDATEIASEGTIDTKTIVSETRRALKRITTKLNNAKKDNVEGGKEGEKKTQKHRDLSEGFWGIVGLDLR